MSRRRTVGCVAVVLLLAAALPFNAAAAAENALRRSSTGEPQTLDPQLWVYGQDGNLAQDMFQGLTTLDAAAQTVPGQAASWNVSDDGLVYRFTLRRGLRWSDGTPLTSADFLYSLRRMFDPATASPSAALLYVIRNARDVNTGKLPVTALGISAPDAATVVIELGHPAPYLLELLVHRAFPVPRHVIERHGREWTRAGRLVSNGAFTLGEWRPGQHVKLVRNPRFHEAGQVKLDAVYHIPIEDPKAAVTRYRAGELHVVVTLPSEMIDVLRRDLGRQLHLVQQIGLEYLAFNTARAPLDDPRVRRALSMAIDRELLGAKVLRAGEPPAFCIVPPGVAGYPLRGCADFGDWTQPQRVAEAKRLLAAAGIGATKPVTLRMRYNNNDTQRRLSLALAAMWQPLGIRTELLTGDMKAHQQALAQGDFDVARAAWYAEDRDAGSFLRLLDSRVPGLNLSRYRDPDFDRQLDIADASADAVRRAAAMRDAETRAMAAQPIAPLYYYVSRRLISPRVRGWVDNPRGVHLNRYLSLAPPRVP